MLPKRERGPTPPLPRPPRRFPRSVHASNCAPHVHPPRKRRPGQRTAVRAGRRCVPLVDDPAPFGRSGGTSRAVPSRMPGHCAGHAAHERRTPPSQFEANGAEFRRETPDRETTGGRQLRARLCPRSQIGNPSREKHCEKHRGISAAARASDTSEDRDGYGIYGTMGHCDAAGHQVADLVGSGGRCHEGRPKSRLRVSRLYQACDVGLLLHQSCQAHVFLPGRDGGERGPPGVSRSRDAPKWVHPIGGPRLSRATDCKSAARSGCL